MPCFELCLPLLPSTYSYRRLLAFRTLVMVGSDPHHRSSQDHHAAIPSLPEASVASATAAATPMVGRHADLSESNPSFVAINRLDLLPFVSLCWIL